MCLRFSKLPGGPRIKALYGPEIIVNTNIQNIQILEIPIRALVAQPITLSLPIEVEIEMGCDIEI